jgi:hypothetical protein
MPRMRYEPRGIANGGLTRLRAGFGRVTDDVPSLPTAAAPRGTKSTPSCSWPGYVSPPARVPAEHPLPAIRVFADEALRRTSRVFGAVHADGGRLSVPSEPLLNSTLLMVQ